MDYFLKRNVQSPADMLPNGYDDYLEFIESFMIEERRRSAHDKFEDKRRQLVSHLPDISKHCFRLLEDSPVQLYYQEQEQDYRDEQLKRKIEQYNRINKINRDKEGQKRRGRRKDGQRERGRGRKIRTTITQAKLEQMNKIFTQFLQARQKNKNKNQQDHNYLGQQYRQTQYSNLKSIGEKLGLGYSTILHKFREFRATKKVKGGALIAAIHQKRKYKKSKQIEELINKSLKTCQFFTAVELSKYIQQKYNVTLSRSIISRHLGQMGYSYKNLKRKSLNKNSTAIKDCRKQAGLCLIYAKQQKNSQIYYFDQLQINVKQFIRGEAQNEQSQHIQQLVLFTLSNNTGIVKYSIKNQPITDEDFVQFLQQTKSMIGSKNSSQIIVLDMDYEMHYSPRVQLLRKEIKQRNISLYYLPPFSSKMSMLGCLHPKIKEELSKHHYERTEDLSARLDYTVQELAGPSQSEMIQVSIRESQEYIHRACNKQDFQ